MTQPSLNDLRVMHTPQVPGPHFKIDVTSIEEAVRLANILADYDLFQFENKIKPDYANMTSVQRYEEDGEGGFDWFEIDEYELEQYEASV